MVHWWSRKEAEAVWMQWCRSKGAAPPCLPGEQSGPECILLPPFHPTCCSVSQWGHGVCAVLLQACLAPLVLGR